MSRTACLPVVTVFILSAGVAAAQEWPSFRGAHGAGVSTSARPPLTWNVGSSSDVAGRTNIPGLGHSSPVVWGDPIYLTTAVSDAAASLSLKLGDSDRAYQISDGARVYQQRLSPDAGGFSASPVAAAGRIYLATEDGKVFVVRAGHTFELLATNDMNEVCMATPALSSDLLLIRTKTHLYALRGQ